jgi:hypothetical protein
VIQTILDAIKKWPYARICILLSFVAIWFLWSKSEENEKEANKCKIEKDSLRVFYANRIDEINMKHYQEKEEENRDLKAKIEIWDSLKTEALRKLKNK